MIADFGLRIADYESDVPGTGARPGLVFRVAWVRRSGPVGLAREKGVLHQDAHRRRRPGVPRAA